ncbi:MAG: DNA polymerase III subunit delta', partial [Arenimonas sp.]
MKFAPWQEEVHARAVRALQSGQLGHALLLAGPVGMGKREVADALAMRLLCTQPRADGHACGECRGCRLGVAQTSGLQTTQLHPDLQRVGLEPNEKGDKLRSEIGVEQIRRLGQWFSLTPQFGGAQVALVDPADALNHAAANALLKTLEEPAPGRFLLLVASRPGRLPATIRSRCQRLEFRLPAPALARDWLAAQGFDARRAEAALAAARGNPGLAARWLREGGMEMREAVLAQLEAVASGRSAPVAVAQSWLGDEHGEARLRFAADALVDRAAAEPARAARIGVLFDGINRARSQLGAPLRHDLVLAG